MGTRLLSELTEIVGTYQLNLKALLPVLNQNLNFGKECLLAFGLKKFNIQLDMAH